VLPVPLSVSETRVSTDFPGRSTRYECVEGDAHALCND
jgi:hypothetical protein